MCCEVYYKKVVGVKRRRFRVELNLVIVLLSPYVKFEFTLKKNGLCERTHGHTKGLLFNTLC